jgi:hypothetical protein
VLVNPDIQEWFDRLQGRAPSAGGFAPRGAALPNYGSDVLSGIVQPGRGMFGFNAPAIAARYQPTLPAPSPGPRGMMGIPPVMPTSSGAGARDLGGGAIAAGLEKIGAGTAKAIGDIAAKKAQRDQIAALAKSPGLPPLAPLGAPIQPVRPSGGGGSPTETFPPIGTASTLPIQAQAGGGAGETGVAIGDTGSLPTFAQGAPGGGAPLPTGGIAAFRHNNPGNVSLPIAGWHGGGEIVGIKDQPGYAHFPDMQTGMDAFQHRVNNYIDSRGLSTIADLNSVYARDQKWGAGVASASGIGLHEPLDTSNAGQMRALQRGILAHEMGPGNADKVLAGLGTPQVTSPSAQAYAAAPPPATGTPSQLAGGVPSPNTSPSAPLLGPVQHGTYNGQDYTYQVPPINAPLPPSRPPLAPVLPPAGGAIPGQQGMAQPPIGPQGNPLAAALAQGGGQPVAPSVDPSILAMALQGPSVSPDFGGFGGLFG